MVHAYSRGSPLISVYFNHSETTYVFVCQSNHAIAVQNQKAVTACFSSKQLQLLVLQTSIILHKFHDHHTLSVDIIDIFR